VALCSSVESEIYEYKQEPNRITCPTSHLFIFQEETNNDAHDPQFEPIVTLPEKIVPTLEEDEDVLFKM